MPEMSPWPDQLSYREAVISSCRASAWEMALALRDDMQQNGIDPDIAGSSALLMECQHRGLPQLDLLTALPALQEGGSTGSAAGCVQF
ncbi:unnamed protein product [Effrenium voratum]|nr:unnamed protein product [Effrenium voratum]